MSSRLTRRAVLAASLGLAGCGFTPALAPGGAVSALRNRVALDLPDTPDGFGLRRALEARLGQGAAYVLRVETSISERPAAINAEGDVTRRTLDGQADWSLQAGDTTVASGTALRFASYAATGSTVATEAAERDARERLTVMLADTIVADLVLLDLPG